MATEAKDHQPSIPPTPSHRPRSAASTALAKMGLLMSRSNRRAAGDHNGSKTDTESAVPPDDDDDLGPAPPAISPPTRRRPSAATNNTQSSAGAAGERAEPRLAVLERIPTYLQPSLPWRERLLHFTFAWYTVTMSTSGIAMILALTPHRFPGLSTIGLIIFLLDLVFFVFITVAIILRFTLYQHTLRRAFTRPHEALFISTFWLSVAAILSNIDEYGRIFLTPQRYSGLAGFMRVAFWVYLAITFTFSVGQYHLLFTVKEERRLTVSAMTPAWILPIFPVMLAGTLATPCSRGQAAESAIKILSAGLAAQGLGILVSVFFYSTYLSRLMAFGLPVQRPGMFIAVGPPSFTCSALVSMAGEVPRVFRELAGQGVLEGYSGLVDANTLTAAVKLLAINSAVFLWGLSFWFFASASVAVMAGMPDRKFHLSWWSFVFPNVGFTLASIRMGKTLGNEGLLWFSSVMSVLLFLAWAFIAFRCVRAVYQREIVWPGHDEDSE
ncbi:voltage-dependent anion channel-domain-containing protein [Cladorrhinum sp. PSN259]|nr:voltage-dependent anion channel-domain-containing protein [Cladorrhinum sp. PSN259]